MVGPCTQPIMRRGPEMRKNPKHPKSYQEQFVDYASEDMSPSALRELLMNGHTRATTVSLLVEIAPFGNLQAINSAKALLADAARLDPLAIYGLQAVVKDPPKTQTPYTLPAGVRLADAYDDVEFLRDRTLVDFELSLPLERDISFSERLRRNVILQSAHAWCNYALDPKLLGDDERTIAILYAAQRELRDLILDNPTRAFANGFDVLSGALRRLEEGIMAPPEATGVDAITLQDLQHIQRDPVLREVVDTESVRVVAARSALFA